MSRKWDLRSGVRHEIRAWAKELRRNPAPGETRLWEWLRARRLGFRFRRQVVLRGWIADFWCPAKRLVVEVDGGSHRRKARRVKDWIRDKTLREKLGIRTLRFPVERIDNDLDGVVHEIRIALLDRICRRTGTEVIRLVSQTDGDSLMDGEKPQPACGSHNDEEAIVGLFLEIQEELRDVDSIEEFERLTRRLVVLKHTAGSAQSSARIGAAIRWWQEQLPEIRRRTEQSQLARLAIRVSELAREAPRCSRGHQMVLRTGPDGGSFWGCSEFPNCWSRKKLTLEQERRLQVEDRWRE